MRPTVWAALRASCRVGGMPRPTSVAYAQRHLSPVCNLGAFRYRNDQAPAVATPEPTEITLPEETDQGTGEGTDPVETRIQRWLPAGFRLEHDAGSSTFYLRADGPSGEKVTVVSVVPTPNWLPHARGPTSGEPSTRSKLLMRMKYQKQRTGAIHTPLRFHVAIQRTRKIPSPHASTHSSRRTHESPAATKLATSSFVVTCASVASTLVVDGLTFIPNDIYPLDTLHGQEDVFRHLYQGPRWNQRQLAERACGDCFQLSPVDLGRHEGGSGSDHRRFGLHYEQEVDTLYDKFGHFPVHTVHPDLYNALLQYLEEVGMTDGMAALLEDIAATLQEEAMSGWEANLKDFLSGGRGAPSP